MLARDLKPYSRYSAANDQGRRFMIQTLDVTHYDIEDMVQVTWYWLAHPTAKIPDREVRVQHMKASSYWPYKEDPFVIEEFPG